MRKMFESMSAASPEWSQLVLCSAPSVPQPVFTITENAPAGAFSWLKAPAGAFTFETRLGHYAGWALAPRWVDVGLGC